MPRRYVPKKKDRGERGRWTIEILKQAIQRVETGQMTVFKASKEFGIPRSTLILKLKGWKGRVPRTSTMKPDEEQNFNNKTALSFHQELYLVKILKTMNSWGIGLSKEDVKDAVRDFVAKNNITTPFKNQRPGDDWWYGFKTRHNLSLKKPERLEGSRARQADDPFIIYDFYDKLQAVLTEHNISDKPDRIWNADETGICSDPGSTRIVCKTGGSGRNMTTVLACVNAKGEFLPPAIVHKGKRLWNSMLGGSESFPNTSYLVTDKGWMTEAAFLLWFKNTFLKCVTQFPCVLIYDGHLSHVGVELIETAIDNQVSIIKLPPHTSHLLQPLDVAVFRGLKSRWDALLTEWAASF